MGPSSRGGAWAGGLLWCVWPCRKQRGRACEERLPQREVGELVGQLVDGGPGGGKLGLGAVRLVPRLVDSAELGTDAPDPGAGAGRLGDAQRVAQRGFGLVEPL